MPNDVCFAHDPGLNGLFKCAQAEGGDFLDEVGHVLGGFFHAVLDPVLNDGDATVGVEHIEELKLLVFYRRQYFFPLGDASVSGDENNALHEGLIAEIAEQDLAEFAVFDD